jgi:hypothetical protein
MGLSLHHRNKQNTNEMNTTIKEIEKNEYIQVLNSKNVPMKKIWQKIGYCRFEKKYELQDVENINNFKYLKKDKLVVVAEY